MNKDKVGLLDIPIELLQSIFTYLEPKLLFYPLMEVNQAFNDLANDPMVMTTCFFNFIKVPLKYGGGDFCLLAKKERFSIIKDALWTNGVNEKISTIAYFTDGGVYGEDFTYFISNIYSDESSELYSSKRGENVNIKAVLSDSLFSHIDLTDLKRYKISKEEYHLYKYPNDTFCYPIKSLISQYEPQHSKQFGILKYHDLNRNLTSYNALLQSFAVFLSMEEIDVNHPLVRLFDGIKEIDQLEKLGFEYTLLQTTDDTHVVEFTLSSSNKLQQTLEKNAPGAKLNGVYPLLWGDISKNTVNYLNVFQRIGFRYMLLKLIDSTKTGDGTNIDCHSISLSGYTIKLGHTCEE